MSAHPKEVVIEYTNWRGVRKTYLIRPVQLAFAANQYHELQWLLHAMLVPGNEKRTFALSKIHSWVPA